MDETEVIYGTIGVLPDGEFDPEKQYDLLNLVSFDGSSYVVHTKPPIGTLPTDINYWQTSAQGTSKATAVSVGTVKPDGTTTEVSADGSLSVKTATNDTLGLVKGSRSITVSENGSIYIPTSFEQATSLVNLIAGEVFDVMLGKISKAIAVTMGLDQNALLKNMLTNMDANDQNKIPTSAFAHTLWERIGMGEELTAGANLTAAVNEVNSNLTSFQDDIRKAKPLPDDTDVNTMISPGTYNVYTTINGIKNRWIVVVDWCNASSVSLSRQTAYYYLGVGPMAPIIRYQYNTGSGYAWSQWYSTDLRKKIILADTGVFHITRQNVIEHSDYYAIAITILPTGTPTTDTPMLTFPSQLATCVLPITTGFADGLTYASNNNQMFYRLLTGTINNTTEILINGIIPKA